MASVDGAAAAGRGTESSFCNCWNNFRRRRHLGLTTSAGAFRSHSLPRTDGLNLSLGALTHCFHWGKSSNRITFTNTPTNRTRFLSLSSEHSRCCFPFVQLDATRSHSNVCVRESVVTLWELLFFSRGCFFSNWGIVPLGSVFLCFVLSVVHHFFYCFATHCLSTVVSF